MINIKDKSLASVVTFLSNVFYNPGTNPTGIMIFGGPAAGKGSHYEMINGMMTQPFQLAETGEFIRNEIAAGTPWGKVWQSTVERGDLVPDREIFKYVLPYIGYKIGSTGAPDGNRNTIFDGFPRTEWQAKFLVNAVDIFQTELCTKIDMQVLYLNISRDIALDRSRGRIVDYTQQNKKIRADDRDIETVKHRLDIFEENRDKILNVLSKHFTVNTVDTNRTWLFLQNGKYVIDQKIYAEREMQLAHMLEKSCADKFQDDIKTVLMLEKMYAA